MHTDTTTVRDRTIKDFGEQWTEYPSNEGYYGSNKLFADLTQPLVDPQMFRGSRGADIGSGSGRIVRMLVEAGAAEVIAVEPSAAIEKLITYLADVSDKVRPIRKRGDEIPQNLALDWVTCFGVLHHIPEPDVVMKSAFGALRPGGRMIAWLYGREGNATYLALAEPLRKLTVKLPHRFLHAVSSALDIPLRAYIQLCKYVPLPMHDYMISHIGKLSPLTRRMTIYDQLNPAYAKYYFKQEAHDLFQRAGFSDIQLHHRHGYSWLVTGKRPERPSRRSKS